MFLLKLPKLSAFQIKVIGFVLVAAVIIYCIFAVMFIVTRSNKSKLIDMYGDVEEPKNRKRWFGSLVICGIIILLMIFAYAMLC